MGSSEALRNYPAPSMSSPMCTISLVCIPQLNGLVSSSASSTRLWVFGVVYISREWVLFPTSLPLIFNVFDLQVRIFPTSFMMSCHLEDRTFSSNIYEDIQIYADHSLFSSSFSSKAGPFANELRHNSASSGHDSSPGPATNLWKEKERQINSIGNQTLAPWKNCKVLKASPTSHYFLIMWPPF